MTAGYYRDCSFRVRLDNSICKNSSDTRASQHQVFEFGGTTYKRVDIVYDEYNKSNLKDEARMRQGHGERRRMTNTTNTPTNCGSFLRDDKNKLISNSSRSVPILVLLSQNAQSYPLAAEMPEISDLKKSDR